MFHPVFSVCTKKDSASNTSVRNILSDEHKAPKGRQLPFWAAMHGKSEYFGTIYFTSTFFSTIMLDMKAYEEKWTKYCPQREGELQ
jgi:hypothetical protein